MSEPKAAPENPSVKSEKENYLGSTVNELGTYRIKDVVNKQVFKYASCIGLTTFVITCGIIYFIYNFISNAAEKMISEKVESLISKKISEESDKLQEKFLVLSNKVDEKTTVMDSLISNALKDKSDTIQTFADSLIENLSQRTVALNQEVASLTSNIETIRKEVMSRSEHLDMLRTKVSAFEQEYNRSSDLIKKFADVADKGSKSEVFDKIVKTYEMVNKYDSANKIQSTIDETRKDLNDLRTVLAAREGSDVTITKFRYSFFVGDEPIPNDVALDGTYSRKVSVSEDVVIKPALIGSNNIVTVR